MTNRKPMSDHLGMTGERKAFLDEFEGLVLQAYTEMADEQDRRADPVAREARKGKVIALNSEDYKAFEADFWGYPGAVIVVDEHGVELGGRSEVYRVAHIPEPQSLVEEMQEAFLQAFNEVNRPAFDLTVENMLIDEWQRRMLNGPVQYIPKDILEPSPEYAPKEAYERKGHETPYGPARRGKRR